MNRYYPDEVIEEVRINNDMVDVVSEYVKLEKKGSKYFGLCPFHKEKTPSFNVEPTKQFYHCFGCGKGGNVFHFIMNIENLDFVEALKLLADRARIQLPESDDDEHRKISLLRKEIIKINTEAARYFFRNLMLDENEKIRQYLKERRLNANTLKKFGIGFALEEWNALHLYLLNKGFDDDILLKSGLVLKSKSGKLYDRFRNRVIFPIFGIRGNVIAFGGRVLDNSTPKYLNSPETIVYNKGKELYGLNFAKSSGNKRILIVEGYMDVISLHQSGIINTVASLGTALTQSQGRILKKYSEEIIISYDADNAGQAATMRGLDLLNDIGCNVKVLIIPDGKDPDEFIKKNGVEKLNKLIDSSLSLIEYKIKMLKGTIEIKTTDDKIKFLNRTADILSKVDNGVEREMYINKLANENDIMPETLFSEVLRRMKRKGDFKRKAISYRSEENDINNKVYDEQTGVIVHNERLLLGIICVDNSSYKFIKEKMGINDYIDDENKKAAEFIYQKLDDNRGVVFGEVLNVLEPKIANDFVKIIQKECNFDDNKKAVLDILNRIELNKLKKRMKEIHDLLRNPKIEGDVEKLNRELSLLVLQIKKQKEK